MLTDFLGGAMGNFFSALVGTVLFGAVILVLGGGFLIWWVKVRPFNTICHILSYRADGSGKYILDKGAFIDKRDGSKVFRLRKHKMDLPQPEFRDYLIPSRKGNVLWMRQISSTEFVPVPQREIFGEKNPMIKTLNPYLDFWRVLSSDRARQKFYKPTFMEKYGGIMTIAVTGIFIFLLIYLVLRDFRVLADVANSLKETARIIAETKAAEITSSVSTTAPY